MCSTPRPGGRPSACVSGSTSSSGDGRRPHRRRARHQRPGPHQRFRSARHARRAHVSPDASTPAATSRASGRPQFFPHVESSSPSLDADEHYHVPLLSQPVRLFHVPRQLTARWHASLDEAQQVASRRARRRATAPSCSTLPRRPRGAAAGPHRLRRRAPVQRRHGEEARRARARALDTYAPDAGRRSPRRSASRGDARGATVHERVREKLAREPVEDFRIDFEDGYGNRPDDEEDGHARRRRAARSPRACGAGTLPPFIGIRIKPLTRGAAARALRTLDIFLTDAARRDQRPAARELRRHAAEDHGRRAGRRRSSTCSRPRGPPRPRGRRATARAHGRDDAVDLRPDGPLDRCRASSRRARAAASARTSAPTTTPRPATSPRRTRRCATRRATSPST